MSSIENGIERADAGIGCLRWPFFVFQKRQNREFAQRYRTPQPSTHSTPHRSQQEGRHSVPLVWFTVSKVWCCQRCENAAIFFDIVWENHQFHSLNKNKNNACFLFFIVVSFQLQEWLCTIRYTEESKYNNCIVHNYWYFVKKKWLLKRRQTNHNL